MPLKIVINTVQINYQAILIIAGFFIFVYLLWKNTRSLGKDYYRLDLAIAIFIIVIIAARLIGISINLENYREIPFNIAPFVEENGTFSYFDTFPWVLFKIYDGSFSYSGGLLGIFFAVFILNSFDKKITKDFGKIIEAGIISYFGFLLLFILMEFLSGSLMGTVVNDTGLFSVTYSNSVTRFPQAIFLMLIIVCVLIIKAVINKKENIRHINGGLSLIIFGIGDFFLHFFTAGYRSSLFNVLDFYQVLSLIIIILGVLLLYKSNKKALEFISPVGQINQTAIYKQPDRLAGIESSADSKKRFSLSYATIKNKKYAKFTLKENFEKLLNLFKRRIKA